MAHALRRWDVDHHAIAEDGERNVVQEMEACLEWFICDCLSHDPSARLGGWWSDGITHLRIQRKSDREYNLHGTTWIGSDGIAPFDIDVTLPDDLNVRFQRVLFRIGIVDNRGSPVLCDPGWTVDRVLEMCPRYNRDWAMAVELTPPQEKTEP